MGLKGISVNFDIEFFVQPVFVGILLFVLLKYTLEKPTKAALLTSSVATLLNLIGIVLHESAHFLTARAFNIDITQIALTLADIGIGMSTKVLFESPLKGLLILLSGSVSGLLLGLGLIRLGSLKGNMLRRGIFYGGHMMVSISLLNLVPIGPQDGSYIIHAMYPMFGAETFLPKVAVGFVYSTTMLVLSAIYFYKVFTFLRNSRQTNQGVPS